LQIKTKIVSSHTADSKPIKQEVNSTAILPPLVFPALTLILTMDRLKLILVQVLKLLMCACTCMLCTPLLTTKRQDLQLKTQPKQHLCYLLLASALHVLNMDKLKLLTQTWTEFSPLNFGPKSLQS
jgi:hypothetical protein